MSEPALELRGLWKRFGALEVTRGVHLTLERGARRALIGPNGAGKTTLINLIAGRLAPTAGEVWMNGRNVTGLPEARRVKAGIGRTFQITSLFRRLTVHENVALAVAEHAGVAGRLLPSRALRARIDDRAGHILAMLRLDAHARRAVEVLPYGVQRMVELAVALALEPAVLLLDEPAAGVPRDDVGLIFDAIDRLPAEMAVLLIEHDVDVVFRCASRVTVLVAGEIYAEGTPQEIGEHAGVRTLYLGDAGRA
jgi:branched-chain amino acid transport system ATP-binding protein